MSINEYRYFVQGEIILTVRHQEIAKQDFKEILSYLQENDLWPEEENYRKVIDYYIEVIENLTDSKKQSAIKLRIAKLYLTQLKNERYGFGTGVANKWLKYSIYGAPML